MKHTSRTALLSGILCLLVSDCVLGQKGDLPSSGDRNGLNFSASALLHRGAGTSLSNPSYLWAMGMGYGIASRLDLGVRILYGNMAIPPGVNHPEEGADSFSGGALEARFLLSRGSAWTPFVGAEYSLVTILHEEIALSRGYSGHGILGVMGCEYTVSRSFGISAEVSYWHLRFDKEYTQEAADVAFQPFDNNVVTIAFSIRFYPESSEPSTEVRPKD